MLTFLKLAHDKVLLAARRVNKTHEPDRTGFNLADIRSRLKRFKLWKKELEHFRLTEPDAH